MTYDLRSALLPASLLLYLLGCSSGKIEDAPRPRVRSGADRLLEQPYREWIRDKRLGLITNQTGVDSSLELTAEKLDGHDGARLTAIFAPEHGFSGDIQAGGKVATAGRIFSLYGSTRAPTQEMLSQVDVLLYDIQDVGSRYYTYISTLKASLEAAAAKRIPFIVLDRPAPLNGIAVEGPSLESGRESFVGVHPIPVRYAMTPAEIASMLNAELEIGADLKVVPMEGWKRDLWYDSTGLTWVPPSPNMPTLSTATVYPGFCLIEGSNLSEGRGTTRPFETFGAPWLDAIQLRSRLQALQLPGVTFRTQSFVPSFSKYQGQTCRGLQVHVVDRDSFRPVRTALHVLSETLRLHPDQFQFNDAGFDRLAGNSRLREQLLAATSVDEIAAHWQADSRDFHTRRARFLLYSN